MRHSYRCHASPADLDARRAASERSGERGRVDSAEMPDVVRCPCCRHPLIARLGREGPYFACRCRHRSSLRRDAGSG